MTAGGKRGNGALRSSSVAASLVEWRHGKDFELRGDRRAARALVAASTSLAPALRASVIFASVPGLELVRIVDQHHHLAQPRRPRAPLPELRRGWPSTPARSTPQRAPPRPATTPPAGAAPFCPEPRGPSNATHAPPAGSASMRARSADGSRFDAHDGPRRVHLANDLARSASWLTRRSSIASSSALGNARRDLWRSRG